MDYEDDSRGYSIFCRDQEVQSSHMKVPSDTFVKEEVRDPSSMTTEFTQISDGIDISYDLPQPEISRKRKGVCPKGGNVELVVDKDIHLEQIHEYLKVALVRIFCGKVTGRDALERWIKAN